MGHGTTDGAGQGEARVEVDSSLLDRLNLSREI